MNTHRNAINCKTWFLVPLFHRAKKLRASLALFTAVIGLIGVAQVGAINVCQKTSQDLLQACQDEAESARSVALATCDNISDPAGRADCRKQAAADFNSAQQTCRDGFAVRQAACQKVGPGPYDPVINPANFVRSVTNPYFPLPPGQTFVYEGHTVDGFVHNDFIVTHKTKVILGVTCTQVHDVVYLDGALAEDTLDWYAQDKEGNVWYFGENTGELINGRVVTVAGTFTAGVNGAKPGIIMEAHPMPGDFYRQEFAPAVAEDNAQVVSLNNTVKVPAGLFHNCLKTEETTPLEPALLEDKYYAAGVGNILTVDVTNGDQIKLVKITTN